MVKQFLNVRPVFIQYFRTPCCIVTYDRVTMYGRSIETSLGSGYGRLLGGVMADGGRKVFEVTCS